MPKDAKGQQQDIAKNGQMKCVSYNRLHDEKQENQTRQIAEKSQTKANPWCGSYMQERMTKLNLFAKPIGYAFFKVVPLALPQSSVAKVALSCIAHLGGPVSKLVSTSYDVQKFQHRPNTWDKFQSRLNVTLDVMDIGCSAVPFIMAISKQLQDTIPENAEDHNNIEPWFIVGSCVINFLKNELLKYRIRQIKNEQEREKEKLKNLLYKLSEEGELSQKEKSLVSDFFENGELSWEQQTLILKLLSKDSLNRHEGNLFLQLLEEHKSKAKIRKLLLQLIGRGELNSNRKDLILKLLDEKGLSLAEKDIILQPILENRLNLTEISQTVHFFERKKLDRDKKELILELLIQHEFRSKDRNSLLKLLTENELTNDQKRLALLLLGSKLSSNYKDEIEKLLNNPIKNDILSVGEKKLITQLFPENEKDSADEESALNFVEIEQILKLLTVNKKLNREQKDLIFMCLAKRTYERAVDSNPFDIGIDSTPRG